MTSSLEARGKLGDSPQRWLLSLNFAVMFLCEISVMFGAFGNEEGEAEVA